MAFLTEGWLLPSDADSWRCLLLLANAKKNAIYVVHLEYGPNPEATHMDYIAEFTVTMPILSFQYALDVSHSLPPPFDTAAYERQDSTLSYEPPSTEGLTGLEPPRSNAEISLAVAVPSSDPGSFSRQPSSSSLAEGYGSKKVVHPVIFGSGSVPACKLVLPAYMELYFVVNVDKLKLFEPSMLDDEPGQSLPSVDDLVTEKETVLTEDTIVEQEN
ncbi:hypothetical protein Tco_1181295 [Tanacetum coccineum]